jgi:16S rRNA (cytosine967-C5)-methyltransferase
MRDISPRAARAGATIAVLRSVPTGFWPLVVVDAPCSGTGTWSRDPEVKWRLTPETLAEICARQADIINQAAKNVAAGGRLAWITCSLLAVENEDMIAEFLNRNKSFALDLSRRFTPLDGGDGFSVAILKRNNSLI